MKTVTRASLVLAIAFGLVSLYGCPKKTEVSSAPESQPQQVEQATPEQQAAAAKAAEEEKAAAEKAAAEKAAAEKAAAEAAARPQPIYFDFDKAMVRDDAKPVLKASAEWLKAHPNAKIRIEGNCDERGTIEYNQALGQRRSSAAKRYLGSLGISSRRISMISYGKEKPICTESTEECWQKNRRDDFVVTSE
jgi:peptidoglycan-associated lipoprotein